MKSVLIRSVNQVHLVKETKGFKAKQAGNSPSFFFETRIGFSQNESICIITPLATQ